MKSSDDDTMPKNQTKTPRPLSISIISWFFILWELFSVIPKVLLIINPEAYKHAMKLNQTLSAKSFLTVPFELQLAHAFVGVVVILISGIFMLKGRLWALITFLAWIYGVVLLTLAVTGLSVFLYLKLGTAMVITIVLTRPKPFAYFRN
jgi:hypothetical protein